jgi:membrane protease YdiL (CAAX protease family)
MNATEPLKMMPRRTKKAVLDAIVCSIEILIFAYFINYPFPYKIIAFIPLIMVAFIISRHINSPIISFQLLFRNTLSLRMGVYIIIGFQLGLAAAMYYRGNSGIPILPDFFKPFAFVAASIGIMEELFFRGFIQTQMNRLHAYFAVFFAALAHAAYKVSLFLSPATPIPHENITLFFIYSFAAYIILGILTNKSKNLLPAIIAHAIFDLVVYAETSQAPWWVW